MKRRKKPKKQVTIGNGFVIVEVENPYKLEAHDTDTTNPAYIQAVWNPKESPAAYYYKKGIIDQAQYVAASRFRALYERAGGVGARAIDYSRTRVDGGYVSDGLTDAKMDAAKELGRVHDRLGTAGFLLVSQICGECLWLKQVEPTQYGQRKASRNLKDCLDTLVIYWGLATTTRAYRSSAA